MSKQLNLYHVQLPDIMDCGYDEYSDFVVAAYTEEEARNTHPHSQNKFFKEEDWLYDTRSLFRGVWVSREDVNKLVVTYIGMAKPDLAPGVIIASFHAG